MNTAKKKSVFAVCDTEMEYARNFMEYLNQKRNIPFEVHAFSSAEMFLEFAKNNETEILLISDKAMKEETAVSVSSAGSSAGIRSVRLSFCLRAYTVRCWISIRRSTNTSRRKR